MTIGRNINPTPNTQVTARPVRSRKYHLGEQRVISTWGISQRSDVAVWKPGSAEITKPDGTVLTNIPVTPNTATGQYSVLVDFDVRGMWEVVFDYTAVINEQPEETFLDIVRIRIV